MKETTLSEEDKAVLKEARYKRDIQLANEKIQKVLKETGCNITIDNTSPLNSIRIIIVKEIPEEEK